MTDENFPKDDNVIVLSGEEFDKFLELLENPPKPTKKLISLFAEHRRLWQLETETTKYWHAYTDRWEARIAHDGEDNWSWWVAINDGEYVAEGIVPAASDDELDEGLRKAKAFVDAILCQAGAWMKVMT